MNEENIQINEEPAVTETAPVEVAVEVDPVLLGAALDGLLLVQNRPISWEKLSAVLGVTQEKAEEIVYTRKKTYDEDESSGLQIAILENGIQLAHQSHGVAFHSAPRWSEAGFAVSSGSRNTRGDRF